MTLNKLTENRAVGTMISEFATPNIARIMDRIGFEFVIIDCEHGSFDFESVAAVLAVTATLPTVGYVRVPSVSREYIGKYLDMGAQGIVAPMVNTAAEAKLLVHLARYAPIGARGISVTRAHSGYKVADLETYLSATNSSIKLYAQIETKQALDNLDDILAVDGLDGVIVGPNDLLSDLGLAGQHDHPELKAIIRTVAARAAHAGRRSGVISSKPELLGVAADSGMTFLSIDSDVGHMISGGRHNLQELSAVLTPTP